MIFLELFITFFQIGLFGFGGGYGMLSLIQGEVVHKHAWLTTSEFTDIVAISQMTPGPIGINSATYCGYTAVHNAGFGYWMSILGSFTATFALVLPSLILMVLIAKMLMKYMQTQAVQSVFLGLRPAVVGLLAAATLGNVDSKWFQLYCCVQRCNSALKTLNGLSESDMPSLEVRKAEMRVLRAHFYFELSRLFNQIPYFDENVEIDQYDRIPNNELSRDEILDRIANELLDAADVLPEQQSEIGRVNKYVAWAYAAKVRLYQAYEQDAQTHAVTNVYSMNDGTPDAGRVNWSNLLNAPQGPYSGDGFFLPSQNLINAYQTDANGLPLFDTFNNHDYDVIVFDENNQAVNTQVDGTVDPRLDFIVGRPNITWKTYPDTPCQNTWVRNQGDYGYHCCKRFFLSPESDQMYDAWPWGASGLNWQIIRYAHVLLWKAEALVELGDAASLEEAREIVNRIRRRAMNSAYVKDFNDPSKDAANYLIGEYPAAGWTQDYARQAVRFETRLETAMEGDRFFDLVRWGIADDTMNAYLNVEKAKRVYYSTATFTGGRDEYLPIPMPQYNFSNGLYVQNPGYGSF